MMVLDLRLPDTNGIEVLRPVRETDPNLKPFRLQELDVRLDAIG